MLEPHLAATLRNASANLTEREVHARPAWLGLFGHGVMPAPLRRSLHHYQTPRGQREAPASLCLVVPVLEHERARLSQTERSDRRLGSELGLVVAERRARSCSSTGT